MARPSKKKPQGIRRKGNRWEVYVRVKGDRRSVTFRLDATLAEMQAWRRNQRTDRLPPPTGSLGRDAVSYLKLLTHKPDYPNQRIYFARWLTALGRTTLRSSITSPQIELALSTWLAEGLSPITVRHHRTALLHLYRRLDGKDAPNPVRETTRPADPPPEARSANLAHVQAVLTLLRPSKTRARLMLILATGIPHAQIKQLTAEDWDRERKVLRVMARRKGRGARGRFLPLSDAGVAALLEFERCEAWGAFSNSAMHSRVAHACKLLKIPPFRPYDLRHVHGTLLYQQTGDLATTARMLGHKETKTAERYTQAAWASVDEAAAAKVGAQVEKMMETLQKSKKTP